MDEKDEYVAGVRAAMSQTAELDEDQYVDALGDLMETLLLELERMEQGGSPKKDDDDE